MDGSGFADPNSQENPTRPIIFRILECSTIGAIDMNHSYDLVIFDCDGVLADTETLDNRVVSSLLEDAGLVISLDELAKKGSGLTDEQMWSLVEKELGHPLPEGIREHREAMLIETFRQGLKPTPGLRKVVRLLISREINICVASNGRRDKVASVLDIIDLSEAFGERIFSADMVPRAKPDPDLYFYAAMQMKTDPSRCVVVEDSRTGVQAGLAAGMRVLGFCPKGDVQDLREFDVETFVCMDALPGLLGLQELQ